MTVQQFSKIYQALLSLQIDSKVGIKYAETDYRRVKSEQGLAEAESAMKALDEAYDASAILRGKVPCPECGEYIGASQEQPEGIGEAR